MFLVYFYFLVENVNINHNYLNTWQKIQIFGYAKKMPSLQILVINFEENLYI